MNEKRPIYISSNLKYLRLKEGKTLKDIAKVVNKTDGAVYFWEQGTREPNALDMYNIAMYFGVDIDDFVTKDLRFEDKKKEGIEISPKQFETEVKDLLERSTFDDVTKNYFTKKLEAVCDEKDN